MSTATDTTFNGWTNYATWRVNLELFDGYDPDGQAVTADQCREMADDMLIVDGDDMNRFAIDYARAFMWDVDWQEIADNINEAHDLTDGED
jgi:hypothetical protein